MTEALTIVITAVTDSIVDAIKDVVTDLFDLGEMVRKVSGIFKSGFQAITKTVKVATTAVVGALTAITAGLVSLYKTSKDYREEMAKLTTAFLSVGSSAEQAGKVYNDLFRFLGDSGKATEAGAHLAKLTTNERELAEWTTALQGVYASFGDSLPIEGLTEASNETAKVGKVTGTLADALNWAGVNEDAFNASLAQCNSEAERETLIRGTLNGLYADSAQLYEKNNAETIRANEAQAKLDATTAKIGKTVQPLITAFSTLASVFLSALTPAINAVVGALSWLVGVITNAIGAVASFFGWFGGGGADISTDISNASTGASNLDKSLQSATGSAQKLKRATAGFDELNVMSNPNSGGGGGGATAGGSAINLPFGNNVLEKASEQFSNFSSKISEKLNALREVFAPFIAIFNDVLPFAITQTQLTFETLGTVFSGIYNNIIVPIGQGIMLAWEDVTKSISKSWDKHGAPFLNELGVFFDGIRQDIEEFYNDVILPVWEKVKDVFTRVWNEGLAPLIDNIADFVGEASVYYLWLYNNVIKPIVDWIQTDIYPAIVAILGWLLEHIGACIRGASDFISSIITVIKGLMQFIKGVFSGDWALAWEGITNVVVGTFNAILAVARTNINGVISVLNLALIGIATGVNRIINTVNRINVKIPDWVPEFGGKTFGFSIPTLSTPQIPYLASGGIVTDDTLARIGEGGKKEAVLPLEQNTQWMDILADRIASRNSAPTKIVLMLDKTELGWANIHSINGITQQTGSLQLSLG